MGFTRRHHAVKLIIGFIFKDEAVLAKTEHLLERHFGEVDLRTKILPFYHTDYYKKEFGLDLRRQFISFKKLIPAEQLPKIKIITNKLEAKFSKNKLREINIDPGYLDLAKLVLASTKNYVHRLYLNKGIFAEMALFYRDKTFKPWEWTYADYRTQEYIDIFNQIREIYSNQIK